MIKAIISVLSEMFSAFFMATQKTPGIESEISLEEGNLDIPVDDDFRGLYGLHNGNQAEE